MTINLLPWREIFHKKCKKRLCIEGASVFVFTVVCSIIWQFGCYQELNFLKKKQFFLEKKIVSMSVGYANALDRQKKKNAEDKEEVFLKKQENSNKSLFSILDKLVEQMPDAIYLTSIIKKGNKLYLTGKSPSHAEVADFLRKVEKKIHHPPMVNETTQTEEKSSEIGFEIFYEIL